MKQHEDDIINALAEQYLDQLHKGETPAVESLDDMVGPHLREALHRRLKFVRLMQQSAPAPGGEGRALDLKAAAALRGNAIVEAGLREQVERLREVAEWALYLLGDDADRAKIAPTRPPWAPRLATAVVPKLRQALEENRV